MKKLIPKFQIPASRIYYDYFASPEEKEKMDYENSKGLMKLANLFHESSVTPDDPGIILETYLMNKDDARNRILKSGYYTSGSSYDKRVAGQLFKRDNLPVYRRGSDLIDRSLLTFLTLGNYNDNKAVGFYGVPLKKGDEIDLQQELINAGSYPVFWYTDKDGYIYRYSIDLNDYGGKGGSTSSFGGRLLDKSGNPSIQSTGFIKLTNYEGKHANINDDDFEDSVWGESIIDGLSYRGFNLEKINGKREPVLDDLVVIGKKKGWIPALLRNLRRRIK